MTRPTYPGVPHVLVVAACSIFVVRGNIELSAGRDWDILVVGSVTSSNLRALGIQRNSNLTSLLDLLSLAGMINHRLVVFVGAVGEVHANDIETSYTELIDSLNGVCLGTNCADNRRSAVVLGWLELEGEGC